MRRVIAIVLVVALLLVAATPAAHAGAAVNVALGLASFAVLNQLVSAAYGWPRYSYPTTIVYTAPTAYPYVVYTAPPVYAAPPVYTAPPVVAAQPPAIQRTVEFPHGRYELNGDGVTTPYQWVWIPKVPPVPPPPPSSTEPRPQ